MNYSIICIPNADDGDLEEREACIGGFKQTHFFTDKTCSTVPPQRKVKHGGFQGQREARLSPI